MTDANKKEELSIVFLSTLCTIAGITFESQKHDDDSTDAIIKKQITLNDGRKCEVLLRVQLKATSSESQYTEDEDTISYTLKVKNYNDLKLPATTPIILALLILPANSDEWVQWTQDDLMIKGRMYWKSFDNAIETKNTDTITVRIDKNQFVSSEALLQLLQRIAEEV